MICEASNLMRHSPCARAVHAVLRTTGLSVPELAFVFEGRFAAGTVRRAVLELRRIGEVVEAGRHVAVPRIGIGRARVWRTR